MLKVIRTSSILAASLLTLGAFSAFAQQGDTSAPEYVQETSAPALTSGLSAEAQTGFIDQIQVRQEQWHGPGRPGPGGPGGGHGPGPVRPGPGPGHGPGGPGGGWHPGPVRPGPGPGGGWYPGPGPRPYPPYPYPPYPVPPGPRGYFQCSAQDGYGRIYFANAYDSYTAQQLAVQQCLQFSGFNCFAMGCVFR